jgi:hypothetical protein
MLQGPIRRSRSANEQPLISVSDFYSRRLFRSNFYSRRLFSIGFGEVDLFVIDEISPTFLLIN